MITFLSDCLYSLLLLTETTSDRCSDAQNSIFALSFSVKQHRELKRHQGFEEDQCS
jgi:hypothetical protein